MLAKWVPRATKAATAFFVAMAALMAVVLVHTFVPVVDPVTRVGLLDSALLWLGLHEHHLVIVLDLDVRQTEQQTFFFQRHLADDSFQLGLDSRRTLSDSQLNTLDASSLTLVRIRDDLLQPSHRDSLKSKLMHLNVMEPELRPFFNLSNAEFGHQVPKSFFVGAVNSRMEALLQWFSVNLLHHKLINDAKTNSAFVLNVGDDDIEIVTAADGDIDNVEWTEHLTVFNQPIKVVGVKLAGLGLLRARYHVLTQGGTQAGPEVRSPCINPIIKAPWNYQEASSREEDTFDEDATVYMGKKEGDYELVRERNGPFHGKKLRHPVANYKQCLDQIQLFLNAKSKELKPMVRFLRKRNVFMEGQMLEKCLENGLTLPYDGGHIGMKSLVETVRRACQTPNPDQPFACIDLMYLAALLRQLLGNRASTATLYSPVNMELGMNADWQLAAAFHFYVNH